MKKRKLLFSVFLFVAAVFGVTLTACGGGSLKSL